MNAFLTVTAFIVLIAAAALVIHRLNLQHADRIAAHRYSDALPGRYLRWNPVGPTRRPPASDGTTVVATLAERRPEAGGCRHDQWQTCASSRRS